MMKGKQLKQRNKERFIRTPAIIVREKFGSKEALVGEVKKIFDKTDIFVDKLSPHKPLEFVSNKKLLRLYEMAQEVKERFGSRKKLVEQYFKISGETVSDKRREKLMSMTLGRLLDMYRRAERVKRKQDESSS